MIRARRAQPKKAPLPEPSHPSPSPVKNADDFPEALTLILELDDSLNARKDLLAVQTVAGLCTLGFCYQAEGRIVVNGLTGEAGVSHDLTDLV